jgi:hypothetical protein
VPVLAENRETREDGNVDRAEIIARLQVYITTIDEHCATIRRMHEDGILSEDAMNAELGLFAQEREMIAETLGFIVQRNRS